MDNVQVMVFMTMIVMLIMMKIITLTTIITMTIMKMTTIQFIFTFMCLLNIKEESFSVVYKSSEIFMAVPVQILVFWDLTLCSLVGY
jgi:hypothetical protein